jgi:hypothetical protein
LLLTLHSAARHIFWSGNFPQLPAFEIDTPTLCIRFNHPQSVNFPQLLDSTHQSTVSYANQTPAARAIAWLRSEPYPDMVASLTSEQISDLTALWRLPTWQQLLDCWPLLLQHLWPLHLYTKARAKIAIPSASEASVSGLETLSTDKTATALLQALFQTRHSWALLSSADYFRDVLLPRLALHDGSTETFSLTPLDLLRLHDPTRGLTQEILQVPEFGLYRGPDAASNWISTLIWHGAELDRQSDSNPCQSLTVLDVGGSRNQLKNWKHVVPDGEIDAVVFTLSLLDYSLVR